MLAYDVAVHLARDVGVRTAGSAAERRAQRYVEGRFRAAGLRVVRDPFPLPGRSTGSRNVIGTWDGPGRCLVVLMAHIDTVASAPGGDDNATGTGVVTALAGRLPALRPRCDVWLAATGAEERQYTGSPDHLGARALVARITRLGRRADLRLALSIDMLGTERRYWLRTPRRRPGAGAREVLAAARRTGVVLEWHADSGTGNSDHREFALSGLPGAVMESWRGAEPCHHLACDTWRRIRRPVLADAQRVGEDLLRNVR
jgi:hypothetical protein